MVQTSKLNLLLLLLLGVLNAAPAVSAEARENLELAPEMAPDNVHLGSQSTPTVKLIENTEYETDTETEWGATVTFMKNGKLRIKVFAQEPGEKQATFNFREGTWKIEGKLVVLKFDKTVAKFEFRPGATADWFKGKVDVLNPSSADKKNLLHEQRLFRSPLKRK